MSGGSGAFKNDRMISKVASSSLVNKGEKNYGAISLY